MSPAPNAASALAARIRKQIVMGELVEGDALPSEVEMVKSLAVSRPTLRQALRILENEHLISVQRGARGGTTVRGPSVPLASRYLGDLLRFRKVTFGDVLQARLMIEPAAVGLLARRHDDKALDELRAGVDASPVATSTAPCSDDFHELVVRLAGNATLAQYTMLVHHLIGGHTKRGDAARSGGVAPESDGSTDAHAALVDLIRAGAVHAATTLWREHLENINEQWSRQFDLQGLLEQPS
ncbi:FCD domain-containing protein [Mycobacterium sp. 236(2023)]|uniref:FadR/GntR family transcriptional regulator n=1 Tax=Mycobacterium sp. 236(2023) TaxID=3038163 RepID=UPI0024155F64|nr:FCD domain-containing protein [Mycobacterium sp. 236(2023)]MDG4668089.1 FCD domain-containing protein [Mycobacterium sp. 236(2023)]